METLISQIKTLASSADEAARRALLDALVDLQNQLEAPSDTLSRLYGLQLIPTVARIGVDLKLFEILAESDKPQDVATLAKETGAAPVLLGRILRFMASSGMVKETDKDTFAPSNQTKLFAQPGYAGGIHHIFDTCGPIYQALPDFLLSIKHQDVNDATNTALQKAFNTKLPAFQWFPSQPERFGHFQQVMTVQRSPATWLSVFPLAQELGDWKPSPEQAVFVDIGGGFGHQCQALKGANPDLKGRVILQELPQTLEHVPPLDGIETQVYNFFEPQPIKGAKFYYLRNIMHDWPDDKCVAILKNLILALGADSRILVDDKVLPDKGVHRYVTAEDISVMAALAARERTREQWEALIKAAGLRILGTYPYTNEKADAVLVLAP